MTKWMIAAVLLMAHTAHADSSASISSVIQELPPMYLEGGVEGGFEGGDRVISVATIGSGQRLTDVRRDSHSSLSWWLREEVVFGQSDEFLNLFGPPKQGDVFGARLGIELRGCVGYQIVCAVGGVDAGLQHDSYNEMSSPGATGIDPVGIVRAGLDLGYKLRVRPAIEIPISPAGAGFEVKLGLALQWD
ncbi:MAG TPA: hypothetical protein VGO00_26660 [Kofleriaceae bacterium]|nr:hypothetical protein [Kofleriaceae bacterium]